MGGQQNPHCMSYPMDMTWILQQQVYFLAKRHIHVISMSYLLFKKDIFGYTWYILLLHFVYKNGSNPSVGAASLALGLLRLVSVCLVSSVISWMPKPAAAHVRDLQMCVLAALPVTWIVGKALVRHIWLSVSSGGSKQVQLSGPHERASAYNEVPL